MLELKKVLKIYKSDAGDTRALNKIDLILGDKGLVFVTGKSGSGKTTLLNVIGGLDGIDSGEILIDGTPFSQMTAGDYDSYRNTYVGFIFQEYNLLPDYTVKQNISLANELQGEKTDDALLAELMKKMGIAGLEKRKINELSGGQKQRVAIVRALIKNPKIIMADEPTGALDSVMGVQIMEALKLLSKDKLVLVVSHDIELAKKYADRIINIVDGKVESDITIDDVEISGNVYEGEKSFTVKSGAELSDGELKELKAAVKAGKDIKSEKDIVIRKSAKTEKIDASNANREPLKLIKSKMKFKSSAGMGLKSLKTKPVRLVFTIILSAVAFAVFGLFDTIAAYNREKIISNLLKSGDYNSVQISASYQGADPYQSTKINLSQSYIDELNAKTGYNFRGVYSFGGDFNGVDQSATLHLDGGYDVKELTNSYKALGSKYYRTKVNGLIEFKESEVDKDNKIVDANGFNYKIVEGYYPSKVISESGEIQRLKLNYVAVSTYFADVMLRSDAVIDKETGEKITDYKGLLNYEFSVTTDHLGYDIVNETYKIVGILKLGDIPARFNPLKECYPSDADKVLLSDFETFMYTAPYSSLFVGEGYVEAYRKTYNNQLSYGVSDVEQALYYINEKDGADNLQKTPYGIKRFYNSANFNANYVYFFDDTRYGETDDKGNVKDVTLNDGEALIDINQMTYLYAKENVALGYGNQIGKIKTEITRKDDDPAWTAGADDDGNLIKVTVGEVRQKKRAYLKNLANDIRAAGLDPEKRLMVRQISSDTKNTIIDKEFKVVGIYYGVDTADKDYSDITRLVINENDLISLNVALDQGVYARAVSPLSVKGAKANVLAKTITESKGYVNSWYGNDILFTISENESSIQEFANLFLIISVVLAIFSVFMLFNYISTSINGKRRSIGVLRAMGSNGADILKMFLTESIAIAVINSVLAVGLAALGCVFVNMYLKTKMFIPVNFALFTYRQALFIVGGAVITAILSSIIPIIKIAKEKPVNLISRSL